MKKYATISGVDTPAPEGAICYKYADPTEDARWVFDDTDRAEIEREDPSLIVAVIGPAEVGERVGRAMAHDVIADNHPRREWQGLDAMDGDQLLTAGIVDGTDEWDEAETAARNAYEKAIEEG